MENIDKKIYCISIGDIPGVDDTVDHVDLDSHSKIAMVYFRSGKEIPIHLWEPPSGVAILISKLKIKGEKMRKTTMIIGSIAMFVAGFITAVLVFRKALEKLLNIKKEG